MVEPSRRVILDGVEYSQIVQFPKLLGDLTNVRELTIGQLRTVKTLYEVIGLDSELMKQVNEKYPGLLEKPE